MLNIIRVCNLLAGVAGFIGMCVPFFGGLLGFFGGLAFTSTSYIVMSEIMLSTMVESEVEVG